jgi:hypothetical protein
MTNPSTKDPKQLVQNAAGATLGGAAGTVTGLTVATAAISAAGTTTGLSGAGIMSGLAAIGGGTALVGGAVLTCGVAALAVGGAFGGLAIARRIRGGAKERESNSHG